MNVTDNANDDDDIDDNDDDDIDAKANLRDTDLEIFSGFFSTEAEKQLWGTPQPNWVYLANDHKVEEIEKTVK